VSAHYGLTSAFTPLGMREIEGEEDKIADVTIAVQALVQNGHLHIPAGRPKVCAMLPTGVQGSSSHFFAV
jgi:hypothetical protein